MYVQQLAVSIVVYAVIGYAIYALWRRSRSRLEPDELLPTGDATRYALASAVLNGAAFRRRVIRLARHRYRAKAPELGLDFPLLYAACRKFEREDRIYDWLVVVTALLALPYILFFVDPRAIYMLFGPAVVQYGWIPVPVVLLILVVKAVRDVNRVTPFLRDDYNAAEVRQRFLDGASEVQGPTPADNVVCYGRRQPFVGLGVQFAGWQVAVEMDRKANGPLAPLRNGHASAQVDVHQLLGAVDDSIRALNIPQLEMKFPLFVSGIDVAQIKPLLPEKFAAPRAQADGETLSAFWYHADPRARCYRWYLITDWNGELVFSYMLRIFRRGPSLAIETAQLILPPIDVKYRRIDTLEHSPIRAWIGAVFGAIARSPLGLLYAVMGALQHVLELLGIADRGERSERRRIARNPAYNYGAKEAIREIMAARDFHVYFQRVDARQHFTAIDRRILNTLTETLQNAGIDVSSLIGQAQTIINNSTNIVGNTVTGNTGPVTLGDIGAGSTVGAPGATGLVQQAAGALKARASA
ncbi:MAG TPA: hypothetical protein VJ740_00880 [Hyphomicrobiaceae bacterium]|nr:hypothetical protein [Hyphomicrobiaceae bacterium]